ncbi:signal peptide-containing protein [Theileria equi strain WA]|uniref:Signal peptide-containing protein n=1 Tax=Theileria equi strain WA TaxID=1537102 RepID=L0AUV3_THEEQ|nr:signal peptide-containing protein [Theileria equi strain WA]AFZ79325.1 signal peptide-containing protein [Theileria equi strain WA]|eukprot:XP_004828991.1 signal peptide-containing protein [Theileria equi strain WA]
MFRRVSFIFSLLLVVNSTICIAFFFSLKPAEYTEMEKKVKRTNPKYVPTHSDVETCIMNNWWDLAKKIVILSHEQDIDLSSTVHSTVEKIQRDSKELVNLLNKQYNELDIVNAALQWAESPNEIFLSIKFSARWSSPGALQVENEKLDVNEDKLEYSGIGMHSGKRKKYQVKLHLFGNVIGSHTKVTPVSMGRFSITLKKAVPGVWNYLNKSTEKLPNQQIWWEMKEKYQEECENFEVPGEL